MSGPQGGPIKIKRDRTRLYQETSGATASASTAPVADPVTTAVADVRSGQKADRSSSLHVALSAVTAQGDGSCTRDEWALRGVVSQSVVLAMGAGLLVPLPLLDTLAVGAIQVRMLARIAGAYGCPFERERARSLVGALAAGVPMLQVSWMKLVPGAGTAVGSATVSLTAGALTYALAKIFSAHFAAGGTLGDFPVEKARAALPEAMSEGRAYARGIDNGKGTSAR